MDLKQRLHIMLYIFIVTKVPNNDNLPHSSVWICEPWRRESTVSAYKRGEGCFNLYFSLWLLNIFRNCELKQENNLKDFGAFLFLRTFLKLKECKRQIILNKKPSFLCSISKSDYVISPYWINSIFLLFTLPLQITC